MIYKLKESLTPNCCDTLLPKGCEVEVMEQTSKNRVLIKRIGTVGLHKVKFSTLRRIGELVD